MTTFRASDHISPTKSTTDLLPTDEHNRLLDETLRRIKSLSDVEALCLRALIINDGDKGGTTMKKTRFTESDDVSPRRTMSRPTSRTDAKNIVTSVPTVATRDVAAVPTPFSSSSSSSESRTDRSDEVIYRSCSGRNKGDGSSWDSKDDADHMDFDAWEVLQDEYATDFGFDFTAPPRKDSATSGADDEVPNSFLILGTSVGDPEIPRHVLSPPIMGALANFLPENVSGQNFWLRYSLLRDGALLETMTNYVRASDVTFLVIETTQGAVFGCFTSSAWHTTSGYYGTTPAFVWKLRHTRRTKCASLFDQAQMESEIDVYMAIPRNGGDSKNKNKEQYIQVCRHDMIAVGGDVPFEDDEWIKSDPIASVAARGTSTGFAICIDANLSRGTTSCCSTFHSPSLCGHGDRTEIFDIAGLEVWTLTPCRDVETAETLEMRKFFAAEQSIRSVASKSSSPSSYRSKSALLDDAETQHQFYRRLGHT